jgi:hypothetical protein
MTPAAAAASVAAAAAAAAAAAGAAAAAAVPGTLKLLLEDIISKLRREGRRELTFGFAPLFNLRDSHHGRCHIHWLNWVQNYIFFCANNV